MAVFKMVHGNYVNGCGSETLPSSTWKSSLVHLFSSVYRGQLRVKTWTHWRAVFHV